MQKATFALAFAAFLIATCALLRPDLPGANAAPEDVDRWRAERAYPPLVFTSKAWLDCSISSTQNGRQAMNTVAGQGFTFDTPMLPIKKSKVRLQKPGMFYRFDAFPPAAIPARFNGLGEGTITAMKAEVEVDVKRFQQPGGPGTTIRFNAADINGDSAYVEFTGLFVRKSDSKRFPFRVLFGNVLDGSGNVTPTNAQPESNIMAKSVVLGSARKPALVTTSLYEAEDDVASLPTR